VTAAVGRREPRFYRLLKNTEKQIPHRLKSVRDEKNKGLVTAHLKMRPFKSVNIRVFQPPV
jgi:hypothetical protein